MKNKIVSITVIGAVVIALVVAILLKKSSTKEKSNIQDTNNDELVVSENNEINNVTNNVENTTSSEDNSSSESKSTSEDNSEKPQTSSSNDEPSFQPVKDPKAEFISKYGEKEYKYARNWYNQILKMPRETVGYSNEFKERLGKYQLEDVVIESSFDGHKITADYILANNNKDCNTMIEVHGFGCNRRTNPAIEEAFLNWGYNVLSYDLSGAGENESDIVSYGPYEHFDLLDCINYVKKEMGPDKKLVVFGYSYGGGVTGVGLGYKEIDEKVDIAILDCPVGDFKELYTWIYEKVLRDDTEHMFRVLDQYMQLTCGYGVNDMSAKNNIVKSDTPVLIFTSKIDDLVPMDQVISLYDVIKHDKKQLHIFEDVPHTIALATDKKDEFLNVMYEFINKY